MLSPSRQRRLSHFVHAALLAALSAVQAWAARWDETSAGVPLLRTFTGRDTGTLAPYRCTLPARDGRLYVAHDGLLSYDGETWRSLPLPEPATVHALAEAADGRIWVGGENLLGSLIWRADGTPEFRSALPQLPAEHRREPGSVTAVFPVGSDAIIAVTENRVYSLRAGGTQVWSLPTHRRLSAWRDQAGRIYVVQPGTATYLVTENGLERAPFPASLDKEGIEWAADFGNGVRLLGAGQRLLRQEGDHLEAVGGAAAELLREDQVSSVVPLVGGFAAVATLRHGIIVLDQAGHVATHLSPFNDFPDNRVVHLALREDGTVVATTPQALAVFSDELRATLFGSHEGLDSKPITAFARTAHRLHLANGQLVRVLDRGGAWQACARAPAALTSLFPLQQQLVGCGGGALVLLDPDSMAVTSLRAREVLVVGSWSAHADGLAWVEGSRFFRGRLVNGALEPDGPGLEFEGEACSLLEDTTGAHWIATTRAGVVRVAPAAQIAAGRPPLTVYRSSLRPLSSFTPCLFRVGDQIFATTETGLAQYSSAGDRFRPSELVVNARVHAVSAAEPDGTVWLALGQRERLPEQVRIARLRATGSEVTCDLVRLPSLPLVEAPTSLHVEPAADPERRILWLGLNGRVVRLESCGGLAAPPPVPQITALAIFDDERLTHAISPLHPRVPFTNTGLRLDVGVPEGRLNRRVHLETRLVHYDPEWVPLGEISSRVFRGLRDGPYRFEARSVDALGHVSPAAVLEFVVQPPWWRSAPAYMSYALGLVLLSALVFFTRLRLARTHRRELEALVAQRTRELAAADAAKSEFLAHINHEIRNPLNGVIGLSSMLANQHHDENTRRLARSLRACAGYLGSVVDNVLDLSRIEAGRIEISPQPFAPRELVEDIAEMFRMQVEEGGGRITWSVAPDLPEILVGDVHRIRQVLVNFTANAARYARGGDVRLSVRQRAQTLRHVTVVFTVADSGPGIAPGEQSRIFEKFARGANTGTDTPRGYGVGLALVRDLAELLGGEADVDSQLGHGAKFRLTIPLEIAPAAPPAPHAPRPAGKAALRALVIDDQAFNRLILRDNLERLGCKVEESADGPSAHLLLQARAHHLAFIDLDLPGLDGLALIRRVRQDDALHAVFLVATTAAATRGIEEQVLAAGADAFLPKPISTAQLATVLETCTRRQGPGGAPVSAEATRSAGLFAALPLTPELLRSLRAELDVETASLSTAWRQADRQASRRHAHRIASLAIIARDDTLLGAARAAEEALAADRRDASAAVDTLQAAARHRLQLLAAQSPAAGETTQN